MYRWVCCVFLAYFVTATLSVDPNEQLLTWVRENSEMFVLMKNWRKLPLISTTWKRIKDTPEVNNDRKMIMENLEKLFRSRMELSNVVISEPFRVDSVESVTFPDILSEDTTPMAAESSTSALQDRINALELKISQLNPICFQSQHEINRFNVLKHNGQVKTTNADSDTEWRKFKDMYDSDKKWIQSQFVPLNYLFDKLKVIEDETKGSRQNATPVITATNYWKPQNNSVDPSIGVELESKLQKLEAQNQAYLEYHHTLEKRIIKIDELVNLTRQELQLLQTDTEEFEYCPDRLDEMTPCSEVGDSCYCFSKSQKNWTEAYDYCERHNMSLLSFETKEESERISSYIKQSGLPQDFYWTSGKDDISEGNWMWASIQENITFENWRANQPDGGQKENCLYLHSRDEFKWGDWLCHLAEQFICEW